MNHGLSRKLFDRPKSSLIMTNAIELNVCA